MNHYLAFVTLFILVFLVGALVLSLVYPHLFEDEDEHY